MTQKEIIRDLENKLKLVNSKFEIKRSDTNVEVANLQPADGGLFLKVRDPNQLDIYFIDVPLGYIIQHEETSMWVFEMEGNACDSYFLKDSFIPAIAAIAESLDQLNKISQEDTNNG